MSQAEAGRAAEFGRAGSAPARDASRAAQTYAALDLGTNNCRLLLARPAQTGFRIVDAFSRIVRLGEGLGRSPRLSNDAIERTIEALKICQLKMQNRGVSRARLIATEACRAADNGEAFIARVADETGLILEVIDRETEAHLAAAGCAALADPDAESVVLFDIGGGSTEIVWLDASEDQHKPISARVRDWASLPAGVVTLSERHGGKHVTREIYGAMIDEVCDALQAFVERLGQTGKPRNFHLLGTSGTVTTLAGVHLGLPRYDRRAVDGIWMSDMDIHIIVNRLLDMNYDERVANACIGHERADLVLAGCAILDAIRLVFPSERVRVADRGLREGILMQLMAEDGVWRHPEGAQ